MDKRAARLILKLTDKIKQRKFIQGESFEFLLRRQHVADALGVTVLSVGHTISILRKEGVISWERQTLTIHERRKLVEIAGFVH